LIGAIAVILRQRRTGRSRTLHCGSGG
jgi:hypothetical protein